MIIIVPPSPSSLSINDNATIDSLAQIIHQSPLLVATIEYPTIHYYLQSFILLFTRPESIGHVILTCLAFFMMMICICSLFEFTNPQHYDIKTKSNRQQQIRNEIVESIPAVFCSTSIALAHMKYIYPLRWGGMDAPIFPISTSNFILECFAWMFCFEIFVYGLHRFLHWRSPIDMYMLIHGDHHVFKFPTAFASQAIHPIEAMLFAETSLIASLLFPISIVTQYLCGILLLIWSIAAHDSRYFLDKGAHYEHHSHPHTNFGFLGFADVIGQTVWWGYRYDGQPGAPEYIGRMSKIHRLFFGKDPPIRYDKTESSSSSWVDLKKVQ
jgi:lathosterol oxidase